MIVLTGATGYIGGRLLKQLEKRGLPVRCLARSETAGFITCDLLTDKNLSEKLQGCEQAYYLVHSMGSAQEFADLDRKMAIRFAKACTEAGVKRIIYLGGLAQSGTGLSKHLKSRHETGDLLREHAGGVEVIEFRASVIVGAGSLSYEMIRTLTERLPMMVTPRWVRTKLQPIAIKDMLSYLEAALDLPYKGNQIYEVGGKDVTTYKELMFEYAKQRGLKRYMIPVPFLTPYLSSLWLRFVTPLYFTVGKRLIDSARHPTVVENDDALRTFTIRPVDYKEAITEAIAETEPELIDQRSLITKAKPEAAFDPILKIGGKRGWYYLNFLWELRGLMDQCFGGVGMRRGRLSDDKLHVGDTLDFWRVEEIEIPRRLSLRAEMKVPGRAFLTFEVTPVGEGSRVTQTAAFQPKGLFGLLYWYILYPIHIIIFNGMLKRIIKTGNKLF